MPSSDISQAVQTQPIVEGMGGRALRAHAGDLTREQAGVAGLPTCKRYLLACRQCEGKLVIAAINQMWTEEKLSDVPELFCTEEVEKCSCGVIAGLAGCWQKGGTHGVTMEWRRGPLPKKAIAVALAFRMPE